MAANAMATIADPVTRNTNGTTTPHHVTSDTGRTGVTVQGPGPQQRRRRRLGHRRRQHRACDRVPARKEGAALMRSTPAVVARRRPAGAWARKAPSLVHSIRAASAHQSRSPKSHLRWPPPSAAPFSANAVAREAQRLAADPEHRALAILAQEAEYPRQIRHRHPAANLARAWPPRAGGLASTKAGGTLAFLAPAAPPLLRGLALGRCASVSRRGTPH